MKNRSSKPPTCSNAVLLTHSAAPLSHPASCAVSYPWRTISVGQSALTNTCWRKSASAKAARSPGSRRIESCVVPSPSTRCGPTAPRPGSWRRRSASRRTPASDMRASGLRNRIASAVPRAAPALQPAPNPALRPMSTIATGRSPSVDGRAFRAGVVDDDDVDARLSAERLHAATQVAGAAIGDNDHVDVLHEAGIIADRKAATPSGGCAGQPRSRHLSRTHRLETREGMVDVMRVRHGRRLLALLVVFGAVCVATLSVANPATPSTNTTTPDQRRALVTGSISLTNQTWTCNGAVNLDSVAVTIKNVSKVGIVLTGNCTGTIKSIYVATNGSDGIHVNGNAHDVTIGGGSIVCTGHVQGAHQDAIQAMSGARVTFNHLSVNCPTANNAGFFVNWSGNPSVAYPKSIVCTACYMYGTQSSTAFVGVRSSQSGLKNSTLCPSRYFTYRKPKGSTPVDLNNAFPTTC